MRKGWGIFATYMSLPVLISLGAMVWLARLTDQQLVTGAYPLAMGAVMLGMGLTLIASFVAMQEARKSREGRA